MGKKKAPEAAKGAPMWMTTFADMVTLLLAFFVMLLSFSSIQQAKFQEALYALKGAFGVLQSPPTAIRQQFVQMPEGSGEYWSEVVEGLRLIEEQMARENRSEDLAVSIEKDGMRIAISSPFLFEAGQADLTPQGGLIVSRIGRVLRLVDGQIRIEGHTDNVPISTAKFPSNWELSSARAIAVLKRFVRDGMDPKKLAAVGYAEFRPIADNDTPEGRHRNRRVEIYVDRWATLASSVQDDGATTEEETDRGR